MTVCLTEIYYIGRPRVYFDITIGGRNQGRIVIELVSGLSELR